MRRASSAVLQAASGESRRWISGLFLKKKPPTAGAAASALPPLTQPLAGIRIPPPIADHPQAPETSITKLTNGLTIASEDSPGPTATIGLYVDCGSVHETESNVGVTHLLERMAFKSTLNRSHLRLVREVEAIGGNILPSASREQLSYTGDVIKSFMPEIVELISDTVRNPVFHEWEVKEQVDILKREASEADRDPEAMLLEALHAGYAGALGRPLIASAADLDKLNSQVLRDFVSENFTASRMVMAGSGVHHDKLLSIAKPLLDDMPIVKPPKQVRSDYTGGQWRKKAISDKTHVAIAFEIPGGWRNEPNAVAATVLQSLLGGGGSFSSGGPGKGVHSRLYTRVLCRYSCVESFTAFTSIYNDSGLFGIQASSGSDFVPTLVELMIDELKTVAKPETVTQTELDRAKNATVSLVLMNLESRAIVTEDMGRQILAYGCRKPVKEFIDAVNALTLEDISNIAQSIISTPVTIASYGDVDKVPLVDELRSILEESQVLSDAAPSASDLDDALYESSDTDAEETTSDEKCG